MLAIPWQWQELRGGNLLLDMWLYADCGQYSCAFPRLPFLCVVHIPPCLTDTFEFLEIKPAEFLKRHADAADRHSEQFILSLTPGGRDHEAPEVGS